MERAQREEYADHEMWDILTLTFSRVPIPRLRVTDPTFDVNIMEIGGFRFASARLRRVLDLDDRTIRYRPVDASLSVPEVQALDYAAFNVTPIGNPFDPDRMKGEVRPARQLDGSLKDDWVLDNEWLLKGAEVYFRADFVPPAPLFRATGSQWIFATDDLAERVMRAGIDDVLFQDITGPIHPRRDQNRKLR